MPKLPPPLDVSDDIIIVAQRFFPGRWIVKANMAHQTEPEAYGTTAFDSNCSIQIKKKVQLICDYNVSLFI